MADNGYAGMGPEDNRRSNATDMADDGYTGFEFDLGVGDAPFHPMRHSVPRNDNTFRYRYYGWRIGKDGCKGDIAACLGNEGTSVPSIFDRIPELRGGWPLSDLKFTEHMNEQLAQLIGTALHGQQIYSPKLIACVLDVVYQALTDFMCNDPTWTPSRDALAYVTFIRRVLFELLCPPTSDGDPGVRERMCTFLERTTVVGLAADSKELTVEGFTPRHAIMARTHEGFRHKAYGIIDDNPRLGTMFARGTATTFARQNRQEEVYVVSVDHAGDLLDSLVLYAPWDGDTAESAETRLPRLDALFDDANRVRALAMGLAGPNGLMSMTVSHSQVSGYAVGDGVLMSDRRRGPVSVCVSPCTDNPSKLFTMVSSSMVSYDVGDAAFRYYDILTNGLTTTRWLKQAMRAQVRVYCSSGVTGPRWFADMIPDTIRYEIDKNRRINLESSPVFIYSYTIPTSKAALSKNPYSLNNIIRGVQDGMFPRLSAFMFEALKNMDEAGLAEYYTGNPPDRDPDHPLHGILNTLIRNMLTSQYVCGKESPPAKNLKYSAYRTHLFDDIAVDICRAAGWDTNVEGDRAVLVLCLLNYIWAIALTNAHKLLVTGR